MRQALRLQQGLSPEPSRIPPFSPPGKLSPRARGHGRRFSLSYQILSSFYHRRHSRHWLCRASLGQSYIVGAVGTRHVGRAQAGWTCVSLSSSFSSHCLFLHLSFFFGYSYCSMLSLVFGALLLHLLPGASAQSESSTTITSAPTTTESSEPASISGWNTTAFLAPFPVGMYNIYGVAPPDRSLIPNVTYRESDQCTSDYWSFWSKNGGKLDVSTVIDQYTLTGMPEITTSFEPVTRTLTATEGPSLGCCGPCMVFFELLDLFYFPMEGQNTSCLPYITETKASFYNPGVDTRSAVNTDGAVLKRSPKMAITSLAVLPRRDSHNLSEPMTAVGPDGFT